VPELAGKVAVVTGGSSGIGSGIVTRFVAEGARVVIADVAEAAGEEAASQMGEVASFYRADVSVPSEVAALTDFAVERFGALDIMVNNAGISGKRHSKLLDDDLSDFHQVMGVNLLGVMSGTREAARHMAAGGGGTIINVSSIGGMQPSPGMWAYSTAKAAVIMFSKSAAIDLGGYGIRVNCIAPGNIETPILGEAMFGHLEGAEREEALRNVRAFLIARQPLERQGTTADLAEAALYFASDRSAFVTGTLLPVDGGLVAGQHTRSGGVDDLRRLPQP
jgi:NAD(P)-dependent dehydrogenase (short-subunit alcohol dehydrogenase family)